jgi:hypothetical protein
VYRQYAMSHALLETAYYILVRDNGFEVRGSTAIDCSGYDECQDILSAIPALACSPQDLYSSQPKEL